MGLSSVSIIELNLASLSRGFFFEGPHECPPTTKARSRATRSAKPTDTRNSKAPAGVEYWLSAWVREGDDGSKYFSLAFTPKDQRGRSWIASQRPRSNRAVGPKTHSKLPSGNAWLKRRPVRELCTMAIGCAFAPSIKAGMRCLSSDGFRSADRSPILHPWPKLPPPMEQPTRLPASVPRSRGDALATLGLHKDADADLIEKTARALRKSWHPDLATSPDDKALRHERSTAINVAVEISDWQAEGCVKHTGLAIPGYVFRDGKLAPATKKLSVSEKIRRRKSKRTRLARGKRLPTA